MNNITFKQFIYTYNFRYSSISKVNRGECTDDTCIIRIHLCDDEDIFNKDNWFEFGIYDFSTDDCTWKICERIFSKEILNSYVDSISYNVDYENTVNVWLTKNKF